MTTTGNIIHAKVNVDLAHKTATSMNIVSIPAMLMFPDGNVLAQCTGTQSKYSLEGMLQESLTKNGG